MEKSKLNDSMVALLIEEEAWKDLSLDFPWTEEQLEKYRGKLDWERVSDNPNIKWTVSMLERFRRNIDWTELSNYADGDLLVPEIVERFEDEWDWKVLSGNSDLPFEVVAKYADRLDWSKLLRFGSESLFTPEFLEMFQDYISADEFKDSGLWIAMVERKEQELKKQILLA